MEANNISNIISEKIKENQTWIEYSIILTIESTLAIFVMQYMFNILLSLIG